MSLRLVSSVKAVANKKARIQIDEIKEAWSEAISSYTLTFLFVLLHGQ